MGQRVCNIHLHATTSGAFMCKEWAVKSSSSCQNIGNVKRHAGIFFGLNAVETAQAKRLTLCSCEKMSNLEEKGINSLFTGLQITYQLMQLHPPSKWQSHGAGA